MRLQPLARRGLLLIGLSATLALLAGAAWAQIGFEVQPWPAHKAPPLQAGIDASGKPLLLKDLRGQALVINFWATWCEPCREELPALARLATSLQGQPVVFLLVNTGDSNTAITKFFNQAPTSLRSLRLPAEAADFRFATLPATVIFDAQGRPRWVINGIVDAQGEPVRSLVEKLQAEARRPAAAPAAKPAPAAAEKPRTRAAATVVSVAPATPTAR